MNKTSVSPTDMATAEEIAVNRIPRLFAPNTSPMLISFCQDHVRYVFTGRRLPGGSATEEVRSLVGRAVNFALTKVFGDDYNRVVPPTILIRRDTI